MKFKPLNDLINLISIIPGLGPKFSKKIAIFLIKNNKFTKKLITSLQESIDNIKICKECGFLTYKSDLCIYCSSSIRNKTKILVVSDIEDVFIFEEIEEFNGVFHILNGLISPVKGITPDQLTINKLLIRIKKNNVKEVILALPKTSEGEITTYYIKDTLIENFNNLKITTLAEGIPFSIDIDSIDKSSIKKSFINRYELTEK